MTNKQNIDIPKRLIPEHLGIIIDGNRRWAREKGLPEFEGHRRGRKKVKEVVRWSKKRGIKILTVYAFSTENWKRSKKEVDFLMRLLKLALVKDVKELHKEGMKLQVIGQKERLSRALQEAIKKAEELTKDNKGLILNLAISYGGRTEITEAVRKIVEKKIPPDKISEKVVSENLETGDLPDPDLIIRTGGEQRLSNFLLWQTAYTELYFLEKYWPDFTEKDLDEVLEDYTQRQRRFGR